MESELNKSSIMREKLQKMITYLDLIKQSEWKEEHITNSIFYKAFDRLEEQRQTLKFQMKVTERLENRLQTLKLEL